MGLIKDRHGTYCARKKVPVRLQAAVARVLDQGKDSQSFLKKSLGTKDLKEANIRAKPVLAGFDRVFGEAEQLLAARPVRNSLTATEIKRLAEIYYASMLDHDEAVRREGTGTEAGFQSIAAQLAAAGIEPKTRFTIGALPEAGLSDREVFKRAEHLAWELDVTSAALARGDITAIREELDELLDVYQISLDPKCEDYRRLAMAVLSAHVKALKDIERRNGGEPVDTPQIPEVLAERGAVGGTFRDAFEGWNKERPRGDGTVSEYKRAVEMLIQLHGDLPAAVYKKSHARKYREALQDVPSRRTGELLKAGLPELSAWGRKNPDAPKVSPATINKQLGALGAIAQWAFAKGVIPEDTPWTNPFANMRVQGERSGRTSFDTPELRLLFATPVFTRHEYPEGGHGPAAFWLPMLALFSGARQAELAGLTTADVQEEPETATPLLHFTAIRIFQNGDQAGFDWNYGGRLYSQPPRTNYQQMSKLKRLKMKFNGEAVAEIDIRASYLTLFYAWHDAQLDLSSDPYRLPGLAKDSRGVAKLWMVATFGSPKPITRWPTALLKKYEEDHGKELDRKLYAVKLIREKALLLHPLMALWGEPLGGRVRTWADLMYLESVVIQVRVTRGRPPSLGGSIAMVGEGCRAAIASGAPHGCGATGVTGLRDGREVPLICPTCQPALDASMPAAGYFAWGCFLYFGKRAPSTGSSPTSAAIMARKG
jgi:hypothetical protein